MKAIAHQLSLQTCEAGLLKPRGVMFVESTTMVPAARAEFAGTRQEDEGKL